MKTLFGFMIALCLIAIPYRVMAEDSPVDLTIEISGGIDKDDVDEGKYGEGQETVNTKSFVAKLKNNSLENVEKAEVIIYVVARKFFGGKEKENPRRVLKKLHRNNISVPAGDNTSIEMGDVEFKRKITRTGLTRWIWGVVYDGYVAEVIINGNVVQTKAFGGREAAEAVKRFKAKNASTDDEDQN